MIKAGRQEHLELGSLSVQRDWSFAGDFAQAFLLIVDHPKPDDYVLASGVRHSVMEFCEIAFARVGLDYRRYVVTSPNFLRTTDSLDRVGNPKKAESQLGWRRQVDFENLVSMMVDQDLISIGKNEQGARS
jgi:GDPmannose 4,6-dehydratase